MKPQNFKFALRHIRRFKEYSLLNIVGLSLGMASAILILLWVHHEVRTDKFHANGDDIYILHKIIHFSDGNTPVDVSMTGPLVPAIEKEVPEVVSATRVTWPRELLFRLEDKMFFEQGYYADSSFFNIFSFPFILGDSSKALKDPNSVVISADLAHKYFGDENPIGKPIRIRDAREEVFTVTGVFANVPSYSTLEFDYIIPYSKYFEYYTDNLSNWGNFSMMSFIQAQPGTPPEVLDQKINDIYKKHGTWNLPSFFVQPFEEYHLFEDFNGSKENPSGLIVYVRIFSAVALFIVFLACMNYTNLATAIATKRGREVGVKKVFGSGKKHIFRQFLYEALTLTFISFLLSFLIVVLALPAFNQLIEQNLTLNPGNLPVLGIVTIVPILTGLLAGIFPAMYMSSFKPITVLKSIASPGSGLPRLRQTLVIFQFVITIVFIISSLLIFKQIKYIQNKTLGLDEDNVVYFPQTLLISKHRDAFKNELEKQPGVLSVSYTDNSPLNVNSNTSDPKWRGKDPELNYIISYLHVDHDFSKTFHVDIITGRDFNEEYASDTNSILINEKFAKTMGFKDPIGERIDYWGRKATIVGVVKDFHIGSMHRPIEQLMMINRPRDTYFTMIRYNGKMRKQALANIEKTFTSFDESVPFTPLFVDEEYAKNYDTEKHLSRLALLFTSLSIVISCLGLFGLALFTAEQRTKEIGIRKTIGARTSQVMVLLTKKFLGWVIISFSIASIISYFAMKMWLENFAYRTSIEWPVFAITGIIAIAIAILTVSWQAYRAANRNPVTSLRYE